MTRSLNLIIICLSAMDLTRNFQFAWSFWMAFFLSLQFSLFQFGSDWTSFKCICYVIWIQFERCVCVCLCVMMYVCDTNRSSRVKVKLNNILLCSVLNGGEPYHFGSRRITFQNVTCENITCVVFWHCQLPCNNNNYISIWNYEVGGYCCFRFSVCTTRMQNNVSDV